MSGKSEKKVLFSGKIILFITGCFSSLVYSCLSRLSELEFIKADLFFRRRLFIRTHSEIASL